jgi:hypothetical protein
MLHDLVILVMLLKVDASLTHAPHFNFTTANANYDQKSFLQLLFFTFYSTMSPNMIQEFWTISQMNGQTVWR